MPTARAGAFLECDIPTKEYLKFLNDQQPSSEKFIISDLGDRELFVVEKKRHLEDHISMVDVMDASDLNAAVRQDLQEFLGIQTTRARKYAELQAGFKCLQEACNQGMFNAMMTRLTSDFNNCSAAVIALEEKMKNEHHRTDLASMMRTVQLNEREKLRLTLTLQTLKSSFANKAFSWQHHPADEPTDLHEGHTMSLNGHCSCHQPTQEPTEEEYNNAVKEAMVLMNDAIENINAVLDEVTCMLHG